MGFTDECRRALSLALRIADAELRSEDLAAALEYRTPIDLARGILMAQNRCTAAEAFEVLRKASNNRNQKLHALALEMSARFAQSHGPAHFEP
ncbi:ANTAR domain-containing protein [Paeniglutamicibacter sp.]|uniref:ANTAR domain-containing protein n=1 Tax=Paeniglutamicibacter sp. TaxID=1934391 RepID=UPI003989432C